MEKKYKQLEEFSAVLDSKNIDDILGYLTDDCIFQAGNAAPVIGKAEISKVFEAFYPSVKSINHVMTDSFESGRSIVYRGNVTYTRLDGSAVTFPVCDVFKMTDGKIAEYYIYIDWSSL